MSLRDTVMTQVVRMRPGDVLWVRLGPDADIEHAENIREAIVDAMPGDCAVIMTGHDLIDRMGAATINDLVELREALDRAIDRKLTSTPVTHEA